ncbi:MAG: hypothetical protein GY950_06205, partial [bacterium]|nr:hypothetical protein [bacterium]
MLQTVSQTPSDDPCLAPFSFLLRLDNIPAVKKHMDRIRRTQTETFAQNPSLWELEQVRRDLRELVKFIEQEKKKKV